VTTATTTQDAEYLWQLVPDCSSTRADEDGVFRVHAAEIGVIRDLYRRRASDGSLLSPA
jgi:hypothetical protein